MGRPTKNLAFIVVDMQNHFSDIMGPSLAGKLSDLAAFMRERGVPVVYTHHGSPDPPNEEDKDVLVAFWGGDNSIKCAPSLHHHLHVIGVRQRTGVRHVAPH